MGFFDYFTNLGASAYKTAITPKAPSTPSTYVPTARGGGGTTTNVQEAPSTLGVINYAGNWASNLISGGTQYVQQQVVTPVVQTVKTGGRVLSIGTKAVLQQSSVKTIPAARGITTTGTLMAGADWSKRVPAIQQAISPQKNVFATQALSAVTQRKGYYPLESLGDIQTQRMLTATKAANVAFKAMGLAPVSKELVVGATLETQRQAAIKTPGRRDEQFFGTELTKWAQRPVELSSAYHKIGMMAGRTIPENPFEYRGDLAVEFLKGAPKKVSEQFSPASGQMKQYLPGGKGLQETLWTTARTGQAPTGSYMNAISVLGTTTGGLFTGVKGTPARTVSVPAAGKYPDVGPVFGLPKGVAARGAETSALKKPFMSFEYKKTGEMIRPSELQLMLQPKTESSIEGMTVRWGEAAASVPFVGDVMKLGGQAVFGKDIFTRYKVTEETGPTRLGAKITEIGQPSYSVRELEGGGYEVTTTTPVTETQGATTPSRQVWTPLKGGFEALEETVSGKVKSILPAGTEKFFTGFTRISQPQTIPMDIGSAIFQRATGMKTEKPSEALGKFYLGQYEGLREKPLTTAMGVGISFGMGAIFGGIGAGTTWAGRSIAARGLPRIGAAVTTSGTRALPYALGGLYAIDVAGRTQGKPESLGRITSTEIIPMWIGGMGFSRAVTGAKTTAIDIKAFTQEQFGVRAKEYPQLTARQAFGMSKEYVKASLGEAGAGITKPVRAAIIDYKAMRMGELVSGPGEYLKYKISLPLQYGLAKAEGFGMKAAEVKATAKEIPLKLYTGIFETMMAAQTSLAKLSADYYQYSFERSPFVTGKQVELFRLKKLGTEFGDVEHYTIFEKGTGKVVERGFGTAQTTGQISVEALNPWTKYDLYHTHPQQMPYGKIGEVALGLNLLAEGRITLKQFISGSAKRILARTPLESQFISTPSKHDISTSILSARKYGITGEGVISKDLSIEWTPTGTGKRVSSRIIKSADEAYRSYVFTEGWKRSKSENIGKYKQIMGDVGFDIRDASADIPKTLSHAEPNILGYAQSKVFPRYFEAKARAPIIAEKALISAETAIWKAGQYARAPGVNLKSFLMERKPEPARPSVIVTEILKKYAKPKLQPGTSSLNEALKPIAKQPKRTTPPGTDLYKGFAPQKGTGATEIKTSGGQITLLRQEVSPATRPATQRMMPEYPGAPSLFPRGRISIIEGEEEYIRLPPGMVSPAKTKRISRQEIFSISATKPSQAFATAALGTTLGSISREARAGQFREVSTRQQQQQDTRLQQMFGTSSILSSLSGQKQRMTTIQDKFSKEITGQRTRTAFDLTFATESRTRTGTLSEQTIIQTPKTRYDYYQIPTIIKFPGLTGWPGDWPGSAGGGEHRGKWKSPFRETIPYRSLMKGLKATTRRKGKKRYVEVGKEYSTVVKGKRVTVRHVRKTGR